MTEVNQDKKLKIKNYLVAGILAIIALIGILTPMFYYTGIKLPQ